jgi:hypothetical protein
VCSYTCTYDCVYFDQILFQCYAVCIIVHCVLMFTCFLAALQCGLWYIISKRSNCPFVLLNSAMRAYGEVDV